MADIPGDASTTEAVTVGSDVTNSLEFVGDRDWFRINLTAGQAITVTLNGVTLEDPYLRIRDASGNVIYENDDINTAVNLDSQLSFAANYTGVFYIDVGSWNDEGAGDYHLNVTTWTQPPVWDNDQIAGQLTSGYWGDGPHAFLLDGSRTITVNITGLTVEGTLLARAALDAWTDVTGIHFQEVESGGQITFDDDQEGAWTDAIYSNGVISTAHVNIDTAWIADYGYTIGTYTFQAYVHEIGHALGLGHAGNYNNDATYPYDALYRNDAWNTSIMSYFSAAENTYFGGQGFTAGYAMTPMVADILAVQQLYGLTTTTRTDDTTYGSSTNTGRLWYDANLNPDGVITIFDNGGVDTLDYSGFSANQTINLVPETFSSVGTGVGNLSIARGTIIENAIGGTGSDTLIGNSANNVLTGGGGNDSIDGGSGSDTASYALTASGVTVNLGLAGPQNTVGAGNDTLASIENLVGSSWNDTLTGSTAANAIDGGGGDDRIFAGTGNDTLTGGSGLDRMYGGLGNDTYVVKDSADYTYEYVGEGTDTVYSSVNHTLRANVENMVLTGALSIYARGNELANVITGNSGSNKISGMDGDDRLIGGAGNDQLDGGHGLDRMYGGLGNDRYIVSDSTDYTYEYAGEGTDRVYSSITHTLRANIEYLYLTGAYSIHARGNELNNIIAGNSGSNKIDGMDGDDRLYGYAGNDQLNGGAGYDRMYGGLGNDKYIVSDSTDYVIENVGEGYDRVYSSVSLTLRANVESLTLTGAASNYGYGNAEANAIVGNSGANVLKGFDGNDKLYGKEGDDSLDGGAGIDWIEGGTGQDQFYGGADSDRFVFRTGDFGGADIATADVIHDFSQAEGDKLRLDLVDANTQVDGVQDFAFIGSGAFTGVAGELRYEQIAGSTYVSGDTNGDGIADFMIRLDGLHTLVGGDFIL